MMPTLALIGLGSNLGDREAILDSAVDALRTIPETILSAASTYHETASVGGPEGQGDFLNAAAALTTTLDPLELLARLREIERGAGRVRKERWGERTLDMDLLLYGEHLVDSPELRIPHPRMATRRFVLAPLREIAPEARDPMTRQTVRQLLDHLDRRPSYLAFDGGADGRTTAIAQRVAAQLGTQSVLQADGPSAMGRSVGLLLDLEVAATRPHPGQAILPPSSEKWLVSDFCLDIGTHRRGGGVLHPGPPQGLSRGAWKPTVAVLLAHSWKASWELDLRFPVLCPETDDPDVIVSEVLAACSASRP